nr:uncharacterized protein LOC113713224 [Coffea arabica]XP_027092700.1 uncharacterized protein LOC113713224 [Coffea arabica]
MRKQRRNQGEEHLYFSRQHEIDFANHFVNMHRASEIRDNNISVYVVPEIHRRLNGQYSTSFSFDSIRAKFYALRELTKLYIAFKRRGTGLGWDSQKFTWLMDNSKWAKMEQVNPKFVKFQNDCTVYHLLEEVFVNQGATETSALVSRTSPVLQPRSKIWKLLHDVHGEREGRTIRPRMLKLR